MPPARKDKNPLNLEMEEEGASQSVVDHPSHDAPAELTLFAETNADTPPSGTDAMSSSPLTWTVWLKCTMNCVRKARR